MIEVQTYTQYSLSGDPQPGDTFEIGDVTYTVEEVLPEKKAARYGRIYRSLRVSGSCAVCGKHTEATITKSNLSRLRRTCEKHRGHYDREAHG